MPKQKPPLEALENIAKNLQTLRAREGITQDDVHRITGAAIPTISRWENKTSEPGRRYLYLLAEAFGQAGPDDFYNPKGLPAPTRPRKFTPATPPVDWRFVGDEEPMLAFNKRIPLNDDEMAKIKKLLLTADKRRLLDAATRAINKDKRR